MPIKPTIHLNGTAGADLLEQYTSANDALGVALKAMRGAWPNARDYYVQNPDTYRIATAEHTERIQKLLAVQGEILEIAEYLSQEMDPRETRRAARRL